MKKSIKSVVCLMLLSILSVSAFGQQCSSVNLTRTIQLDGSSATEEIKIEISEDTDNFQLSVNSTIQSGHLTVEIYDPKGNKQGNFSVESQLKSGSKKKENVCGQMQKLIEDPSKGEWIVKLIPNKAEGNVSIYSSLIQEN